MRKKKKLKDTLIGGLALGVVESLPLAGKVVSNLAGNLNVPVGKGNARKKLSKILGAKKRGFSPVADASHDVMQQIKSTPQVKKKMQNQANFFEWDDWFGDDETEDNTPPPPPTTEKNQFSETMQKAWNWVKTNWKYLTAGGVTVIGGITAYYLVNKPKRKRRRR